VEKEHTYRSSLVWTGNLGVGTSSYRAYARSYTIRMEGKPDIDGSSDPTFRGDPTKPNPEELLLSALSSCHMLWYLHLCAEAGVIVTGYSDNAVGVMVEEADGRGQFTEVVLYPSVSVAKEEMISKARALHREANDRCFIARSVNFPVQHVSDVRLEFSENK
jgi:organic hydroperoxide reductase OsmC/OhrA